MQNQTGLTDEQRQLEGMLAGLTPTAAGLSRDTLIFQAGAASVRHSRNVYRLATAALTLLLAGTVLYHQGNPQAEQPRAQRVLVQTDRPTEESAIRESLLALQPSESADLAHAWAYLRLRDRIIADPQAALPQPTRSAQPRQPDALQELLRSRQPLRRSQLIEDVQNILQGEHS